MNRKWFLRLLGMGGIGSLVGASSFAQTSNELIKPQRLQKGDTIGLISPGMILPDRSRYDEIIDQIKKMGFKVKEGPNARNRYGYLAGSDKERADDLNAMFADNSVDAILPFRGGWGCNRILHLIDYQTIRQNPKILVGFSDITSLLMAIYAKTGLITFHGPVGKSDWTDYTTDHFKEALSYRESYAVQPSEIVNCEGCNDLSVISPGKATGKFFGGNLSVLTAMVGSAYLPEWEGSVLFIEDVGEAVYRIDRMITQLKISGILDQISGFVFGKCPGCDRSNSYSLTLDQVLADHIKPLGIPAFSGAMFGHIENNVTLPVGINATINAQQGSITFTEAATM